MRGQVMTLTIMLARLALAGQGLFSTGVVFLLGLVTLMPFALGPDMALLSRLGPALIWIGALLAVLLDLDRIFKEDLRDGFLDLWRLSGRSLVTYALIRLFLHWLLRCLPLIVSTVFMALFFNLAPLTLAALVLSLLIGTPALVALGGVGSSLMAVLDKGGLLMVTLILPLTIPVLIFGVAMAQAVSDPLQPFMQPLLFLIALSLSLTVIAPLVISLVLRLNDVSVGAR
jgi:heme exporter protein B